MLRRDVLKVFVAMSTAGSVAGGSATALVAQQVPLVKIDGSSTVFPTTEAAAEDFQRGRKSAIRVMVGVSGTSGGFKKFCRGDTDISNASRPILKEEMEVCSKNGIKYIELPVCFDALTVAVSPKSDWVKSVTVAELKKLWEPAAQGKVTKWNQIRPEWPNQTIRLFGAGSDSGTFDYFTEAIVGKARASRADYLGSEDDHVLVQGIAKDRYALGYIPFAYFEPNRDKLKSVAIDAGKGPVMPSLENVLNGMYSPLSRPLFMYVKEESAKRPEVREFVDFYLRNGAKLAAQVKYLPLPAEAYKMGLDRFASNQLGTGFGGILAVGLPVAEILKRQPKL